MVFPVAPESDRRETGYDRQLPSEGLDRRLASSVPMGRLTTPIEFLPPTAHCAEEYWPRGRSRSERALKMLGANSNFG